MCNPGARDRAYQKKRSKPNKIRLIVDFVGFGPRNLIRYLQVILTILGKNVYEKFSIDI
jgi:hypothetical protein